METYNHTIDMVVFCTDTNKNTAIERASIPLHLIAKNEEDARAQACEIAQGMARAFNNCDNSKMYYRITIG